ncbi:MAG: amidohydrolase, partial [Gemmatimonadales bacterium]
GERGGAELMIEEGALANPAPTAIFGLHVLPFRAGRLRVSPGGLLASADVLRIVVHGRQTHGAQPWRGVDPIVVAAQIVLGLQTITSRQLDLTAAPAVITIGSFQGGVRMNIVPDSVVLLGTIRAFDPSMQRDIHERVRRTAARIAESAGATAEADIRTPYPVTFNDSALTRRMLPALRRVVGEAGLESTPPLTVAEDFSHYQRRIPGMFFLLGITPAGTDPAAAAPNHSPRFFVDEAALVTGVRALASLAVDYLAQPR